ncbi:MAG TPA: YfhO family protein [Bacteroidaceae bacterium]|nr:YfhO family protein [Bacteroidaceae bacterium]
MDNNTKKREYLPYLIAILLFVVISTIYCLPVLEGKVIQAGDDINGWAAVQEPLQYRNNTGNISWWTGSMFSGMPNYQIGGGRYLSTTLMKPLWKLTHPSAEKLPLVFVMFFICFYILLRSFKVDRWLSIAGALAIGFSSYFFIIEAAGHNSKAWSIALMSVVVAGFFLIFNKRYGWGVALTMLFTAFGFSPHPQMAYYIFLLIGVLFFAELFKHIKEKRYKDLVLATTLFVLSVIVGLGTGSANIFANKEYASETMRGGHSELIQNKDLKNRTKGLDLDYATAWSYGIDETFTLLIPGFMGSASTYDVGKESKLYKTLVSNGVSKSEAANFSKNVPMYWGEQPFTVGSVYIGAIVCFLFVLGLFIVKGPYKWALLIATLFSISLSWGKNLMWLTNLFFEYFPLYNKFRAVSSILIIAEITMPLLGFLAIKNIMDGHLSKQYINKKIVLSAGITAGVCLLLSIFGGAIFNFNSSYDTQWSSQIPEWLYSAIKAERATMLRTDSFRSFIFIVISAGVLWLYTNKKMGLYWMVSLFTILIIADMWPINRRFLNDNNFVSPKQNKGVYAIQPYEEALLRDPDPHFRVLNLTTNTFNEARTSYRLKSIGGYSAAKLRRYQDIIEQHISKLNIDVISMLNGKYFIVKNEDGNIVPQFNPNALGNAWRVDSILVVSTPDQECAALGVIDLSRVAVLDEEFYSFVSEFQSGSDQSAKIDLTSYAPDVLTYNFEAEKDALIVFSEIYYPYGWKAYIDGEKVDVFRVNYLLRALNIPAGTHDIRFEFRPDSVKKGNILSAIFIFIMYAVVLVLIGRGIYSRLKK